jgi:hypothetical protein
MNNHDFQTMQIYANIIIYRHLIFLWVSEGFSHFFYRLLKVSSHVSYFVVFHQGGRQLGQDFLGRHGVLL